jgi:hypothetical protein
MGKPVRPVPKLITGPFGWTTAERVKMERKLLFEEMLREALEG